MAKEEMDLFQKSAAEASVSIFMWKRVNPFPHTKYLQQTTLKVQLKVQLNRIENMVTKGEIACFEQFSLLSPCFQKTSAAEVSESVYIRERVKKNKICIEKYGQR